MLAQVLFAIADYLLVKSSHWLVEALKVRVDRVVAMERVVKAGTVSPKRPAVWSSLKVIGLFYLP